MISGLVGGDWTGPSSEAAAAAAAPYVSWLSTTAGQAEQTAGQARAAASAYETALAATVPPAEILANRTQLLSLLQTNIFGQNNAAIAALEAEYAQFWAQDVAAITGYADRRRRPPLGWARSPRHRRPPTTRARPPRRPQPHRPPQRHLDPTDILDPDRDRLELSSTALTSFNSDYTNFFTNAFGLLPGGSNLSSV